MPRRLAPPTPVPIGVTAEMALNMAIGIAEKRGLRYQIAPDGKSIRVPKGSSAVIVGTEVGTMSRKTYVTFSTPLVQGIKLTPKKAAKLYAWVNFKNASTRLCRLIVIETTAPGNSKANEAMLRVDYELLADDLAESMFMQVLSWLWGLVDAWDDEAQKEFGGHRHFEPQGRKPAASQRVSETVTV